MDPNLHQLLSGNPAEVTVVDGAHSDVMNVGDVVERGQSEDFEKVTNEARNLDVDAQHIGVINIEAEENQQVASRLEQTIGPSNDENPIPMEQATNHVSSASESVSAKESLKEHARKKRRARLDRFLRPGAKPSFIAIISQEDDSRPESPITINVDEYLGLTPQNKKPAPPEEVQSSHCVADADETKPGPCPLDEGWYEGVVPLALPDEGQYLSEYHLFIRSQLELFSATQQDVETSMPGRRTPTIRGKVGIRCIHCSRKAQEANAFSKAGFSWPAGAVSYPLSIAGLYTNCAQKPAMHFEKCPNMSVELKTQMYRLTHDINGQPAKRQRKVTYGATRSISTQLYYIAASKRIGLVDAHGGIRFGRDLALEPLPMETVLAQIEGPAAASRDGVSTGEVGQAPSKEPRITADGESERVLARAVSEKDDEKNLLGRSSDKNLVTDFMFLCIRQMVICHATPSDCTFRGKRSKLMRVGFAGFCCRHCGHESSLPFHSPSSMLPLANPTCRCFSSAPDSLSSTISNTFASHLEKCHYVPPELKNALTAYKRLHSRQIRQMRYGAQRELFQILWDRLRKADLSEEEMEEKLKNAPRAASIVSQVKQEGEDTVDASESAPSDLPVPDAVDSAAGATDIWIRPDSFPVSSNEATKAVLKRAEDEDGQDSNDQLLLPSDRGLISDYVFLIMKQLKVAFPNSMDFAKGKAHPKQPGLRCKHCIHQDPRLTLTGRSFPSQPDNIATTLNTSLYQHLQKCPFVPDDIRHALSDLKKIHSVQRSSLRFGAQRRFYNLLFQRLRRLNTNDAGKNVVDLTQPVSEETLGQFGFVRTVGDAFECQNCRMVPLSLRARDSCSMDWPTVDFASGHKEICASDSFDLSLVTDVLTEAINVCPAILHAGAMSSNFKEVVQAVVGGQSSLLMDLFTSRILKVIEARKNPEESQIVLDLRAQTKGLWTEFGSTVDYDKLTRSFEAFAASTPSGTMSTQLGQNKEIARFLRAISPSLVIPAIDSKSSESPDDNSGDYSVANGTDEANALNDDP